MDFQVLNSIRNSKGFSRSVTYLIILAIMGITLERIIYYSLRSGDVIQKENVVEKMRRLAPYQARQLGLTNTPQPQRPPSQAEQLSNTVVNLQETVNEILTHKVKATPQEISQTLTGYEQHLRELDAKTTAVFDKNARHIKAHNLPEVIHQRQARTVANYRQHMDSLIQKLGAIKNLDDLGQQQVQLGKLKQLLDSSQQQRSQQPFDPNKLPMHSETGKDTPKPKLTAGQYAAAGLYNTPRVQIAALGDFSFKNLAGADNPAYLGESVEVQLTQAIKDKAATLNHDPVQIYHWVRNNVEWLRSEERRVGKECRSRWSPYP